MLDRIRKLFYKYFDYEIIGEYYEYIDDIHIQKKYIKRYKLRKQAAGG